MGDAAARPLRVLVADDELMARRRLARLLASMAGVELVAVHLVSQAQALLTDLSLQEIQRRVPAGTLERVHRQALLNLAHVRSLRPLESGGFVARTTTGRDVPVSRQSARELRRRLGI